MYDLSVEGPFFGPYGSIDNESFYISSILTVSTFPIRNASLETLIDSDIDRHLRYGYYVDLKVLEQKEILFNNKTAYKIVYIGDSNMPNENKTMRLFTIFEDNFYLVNIFASSDFYKNYGSILKNILNSIAFK